MSPVKNKPAGGKNCYRLVFDGGSRGNPGAAYGSFRISDPSGRVGRPVRLTFGRGTNNEAEYKTLIAALQALQHSLTEIGLDPKEVCLEVRGDSRLVIQQLRGEWKAKDSRMRVLRNRAARLLEAFGEVRLEHQPRAASVAALGH